MGLIVMVERKVYGGGVGVGVGVGRMSGMMSAG